MKLFQIFPEIRDDDFAYDSILIKYEIMQFLKSLKLGRPTFLAEYKPYPAKWCNEAPKSDFPPSGGAMMVFTDRAIAAVREVLSKNVDILPLDGEWGSDSSCSLVILWERLKASDCRIVKSGLVWIQSVQISSTSLPDIFKVEGHPGVLVSEKFMLACDSANLVGIQFKEVEQLASDAAI